MGPVAISRIVLFCHGLQERQIQDESREFLDSLRHALEATNGRYISSPEFSRVRENLRDDLHIPPQPGVQPLGGGDVHLFAQAPALQPFAARAITTIWRCSGSSTWEATILIDKLGLYITEVYQKGRNQVIARQQEEMLELSTPVVQLWDGVLALPLIGTLDSARTQVVMQNLLEAIVQTGAEIAIIDITGVPTVDTLVAQHLLKTIAAARLMGADCIVSGIRPQIAQTIIHLGVDLTNVITKATLADAFAIALRRSGMAVVRARSNGATANSVEVG